MTDLELFKKTLISIKCKFTSVNTLVGYTVSVYTDTKETQFEFDYTGKFSRVI